MDALIPIEQVAERLGLNTRSIYRLERSGKIGRRATEPGKHPCWAEAVVRKFQSAGHEADVLVQKDIESNEEMETLLIPCGDRDIALRQMLRKMLKLQPHVPEAEVMDAVLDLQTARDALRRDYEAACRKLRLWATALRGIAKTVNDLREPPTELDLINRRLREEQEKAAAKKTPEEILAIRVPDILSAPAADQHFVIEATLRELQQEADLSPEDAKIALDKKLAEPQQQ